MSDIYYSQGNFIVRRSVMSDIDVIAPHIREADRKEIWASHHITPRTALYNGIMTSLIPMTIELAGEPCVMFGVCPQALLGNTAILWMLGTPKVENVKVRFIRNNRKFIDMFLTFYPFLTNFVHVENTKSIAWLKWLGAEFDNPARYGIEQEYFMKFYFHRN